jgi:3-methyl-2-oxobutanoate hydroxymethyltransferase
VGGYREQGREESAAARIREEARRLEEAGCFSVVLEMIPAALAADVTRAVHIPTIGIGAGAAVDGQVLVLYDMLGLNDAFKPKFLRRFANIAEQARGGIREFAQAVREGSYPAAEHSFD